MTALEIMHYIRDERGIDIYAHPCGCVELERQLDGNVSDEEFLYLGDLLAQYGLDVYAIVAEWMVRPGACAAVAVAERLIIPPAKKKRASRSKRKATA